jgi:RNA polymerase sigma factor (sigma-70 family)
VAGSTGPPNGGDMGQLRSTGTLPAAPMIDAGRTGFLEDRGRALLVERAQAGDREAFEALLDRWLATAYRTACAILGDEADARDATQDAFLRAWRGLPRLRDPDRFDAWLSRILVNRCRTLRGRRHRATVREIHLSVLPERQEPSIRDGPWADPPTSLDVVERAFERISVGDRTLLVLHHLDHHSVAEIAARLRIPVGTAKSRLFAARHALQRALEVELR